MAKTRGTSATSTDVMQGRALFDELEALAKRRPNAGLSFRLRMPSVP
jgi:hypothetical protein